MGVFIDWNFSLNIQI